MRLTPRLVRVIQLLLTSIVCTSWWAEEGQCEYNSTTLFHRRGAVITAKESSGCEASPLDGGEEEDDDWGDDSWSARGDGDASHSVLLLVRGEVDFPSPSDVDGEVEGPKSTSSGAATLYGVETGSGSVGGFTRAGLFLFCHDTVRTRIYISVSLNSRDP